MKKFLFVLSAILLLFGLVACDPTVEEKLFEYTVTYISGMGDSFEGTLDSDGYHKILPNSVIELPDKSAQSEQSNPALLMKKTKGNTEDYTKQVDYAGFSKAGYSFYGWADQDGKYYVYNPNDTKGVKFTKNVILEALWRNDLTGTIVTDTEAKKEIALSEYKRENQDTTLIIPRVMTVWDKNGSGEDYLVTSINEGAVTDTSLETIILPDTVTTIKSGAFSSCSANVKIKTQSNKTSEIEVENGALPSGTTLGVAEEIKTDIDRGTEITGIKLYSNKLVLCKEDSQYISYSVLPLNASGTNVESVTFSSSDTTVATVTNSGVITASKDNVGNVTITATLTTKDGATFTDTCTVVVADSADYMLKPGSSWYVGWIDDATKITKITFTDTKPSAITSDGVDLTNGQTGKVMGYVSESGTEVYVVGDFIFGNPECLFMFNGFSKLETIDFGNFDTSKTTNMYGMFQECNSLESFDLSSFDTSHVTDMGGMFDGCSSLTTLDLSSFNTSAVTNMVLMFDKCSKLTSVDIRSFDTSKVIYMTWMFSECSSLTTLDISSFDTSKVTSMYQMFYGCSKIKTIYVSDEWSTAGITAEDNTPFEFLGSGNMFEGCVSLIGGSGTGYNAGNPTDKTYGKIDGGTSYPGYLTDVEYIDILTSGENMWTEWKTLNDASQNITVSDVTKITFSKNQSDIPSGYTLSKDLTKNQTEKVMGYLKGTEIYIIGNKFLGNPDCSWMFTGFRSLTEIKNLGDLDTSKVSNMEGMFEGCSCIQSLDVSEFNTSKVINMAYMFQNCYGLTSLNVSEWDTSNVTDMKYMFTVETGYELYLTSLDLSKWNTSSVTDMAYMFCGRSTLNSLTLKSSTSSTFVTSNVEDMSCMFSGCVGLTTLDLSNFDTSKVLNMESMFSECSGLTTLDLSSFNTSKVTDMSYMFNFYGTPSLTTIYVSGKWTTSNVTDSDCMFGGCTSLVGGSRTGYDSSKTDKEYGRIDGGTSTPGYLTDISQKQ